MGSSQGRFYDQTFRGAQLPIIMSYSVLQLIFMILMEYAACKHIQSLSPLQASIQLGTRYNVTTKSKLFSWMTYCSV